MKTNSADLDELVTSLLYEGYALYPYTPTATKNATPTPFGIVYPPAYASRSGATFDRLQVEGLLHADAHVPVIAELRFLVPTGERHEATEQRILLGPASTEELCSTPLERRLTLEQINATVTLSASRADEAWRVRFVVVNASQTADDGERVTALRSSLISVHVVLRSPGGRFVSPLEAQGCEQINTWPVLATSADDTLLGAAIVLPDHPQLSVHSRGALFDNTEIEEALLLHVHALSDEERRGIEQQDPAVKEMVRRALQTTPEDIFDLHGVFGPAGRPPSGPPSNPGEAQVEIGEQTIRRGDSVVLRLASSRDVYDQILNGRTATVERIYRDTDDRVYFGVTIDGDVMQEIMQQSGRYHFFFADEVEVIG